MKISTIAVGALSLSLIGTGCATKKYVNLKVAPVETRVGEAEKKNGDQDSAISGHTKQIEDMDRDASRTKESLKDVDAKAQSGLLEAQKAHEQATTAQGSADNARSLAERGLTRADQLEKNMDAMNKFQAWKTESVLFKLGQWELNKDAKEQLDELGKSLAGLNRFVIEIQGFTDKTGPAAFNEELSQRRAEAVARYLSVTYKVPLRNIHLLGSGWAQPVADDKTREGRKQNRRVEVRVFVPQSEAAGKNLAAKTE